MKKIISILLSIIMLVSVMPIGTTAFADDTVVAEHMQVEFLNSINNAGNPDEIIHIIEENEWAIQGCSNYAMYMDAPYKYKAELVNLLMFELPIDNMDDFSYRFDSCIVLTYINLAVHVRDLKDLIERYYDLLGLDMARYFGLDDVQKMKAMENLYEYQFICVDDLRDRFERVVKNVIANSVSGGVSGGGGGSSNSGKLTFTDDSVSGYTYDRNGNVLQDAPADGTEVTLKLQIKYKSKPCKYTVATYDENGTMKSIEVFSSYASKHGESQFYDFNTIYENGVTIKVITMESLESLVPADDVQMSEFPFGKEVPEAEEETEGITAYKGVVQELYADSFELRVDDKREFGYWGAEIDESTITVNGMFPEIVLIENNPETIYNIKEVDGEYYFDSIDTEGEFKTIVTKDVDDFDFVRLVFTEKYKQITYSVSPAMDVYSYYEPVPDIAQDMVNYEELMYIYVVDGEVKGAHFLSGYAEKVVGIGRGKVLTSGGSYNLDECFGYIPEVGDVVIITPIPEWCCSVRKAEKIEGRYFGDFFMTDDGDVYDLNYWGNESFYNGELCYGYLDTLTSAVKFIEKMPKDVIFVSEWNYDDLDDILEIRTQDGVMDIGNARFVIDGVTYKKKEDIFAMLSGETPAVYMVSEYNDRTYYETTRRIYEGQVRYFAQTNTLGGYILNDDTEIVAFDGRRIFTQNVTLTSGMTYEIKVYSDDGFNADYIMIMDYNNQLVQQKITMVVTSVTSGIYDDEHYYFVDGYKDSEEYTLRVGAWLGSEIEGVRPGDIVVANIEDGEVVGIAEIVKGRYGEMIQERGMHSLFAPVWDSSDKALIMQYEGNEMYTMVIDERTDVYIYDYENNTVSPASMADILFTYPEYGWMGDWAFVYTAGSVISNSLIATEIVVIVPNNQ